MTFPNANLMHPTVQLEIPEFSIHPSYGSVGKLREAVEHFARFTQSPIDYFGLELKAAALIGRYEPMNAAMFRKLSSRPAVEPILMAEHSLLSTHPTSSSILRMSARLGAANPSLSERRMRTIPAEDKTVTWYADDDQRCRWSEIAGEAYALSSCQITGGILRYICMVICHPLTDGNGRSSRAFLYGAFLDAGVLTAPTLPFAPALFRHRQEISAAFAHLATEGSWIGAVDACANALLTAVRIAEQLRAECRRSD